MVSEKAMQWFRIGVVPLVVYSCAVVVGGLTFQYATEDKEFHGIYVAEALLTYWLVGMLIVTLWAMMRRFEHIKGRAVSNRTKLYFKILLVIYTVSAGITIGLKLLSMYLVG